MDSSAASNSIMALTTTASSTSACTITSVLLNCQSLDGRAIDDIRVQLCKRTVKELGALAKSLGVRLGGSIRKADIIERLLSMARIGAVRDVSSQPNSGGVDDFIGISYITPTVIGALRQLPTFESISQWKKETKGCLKDFTFMNLLIYLVYGRDKSFDMQSLKAFKSLKAYKFFYDGFVKNVWVYECLPATTSDNVILRVVYFRAYVHHSLSCESPLLVFVSINGETGDVYSAKCNCVSG